MWFIRQTEAGRLWFARLVSAQRSHAKRVNENTFYSLVQHFAIVLFECGESDDFSPAKILMNMCFTFYYEGTDSVISFHDSNSIFQFEINQLMCPDVNRIVNICTRIYVTSPYGMHFVSGMRPSSMLCNVNAVIDQYHTLIHCHRHGMNQPTTMK